jgi:hypothetical protein
LVEQQFEETMHCPLQAFVPLPQVPPLLLDGPLPDEPLLDEPLLDELLVPPVPAAVPGSIPKIALQPLTAIRRAYTAHPNLSIVRGRRMRRA